MPTACPAPPPPRPVSSRLHHQMAGLEEELGASRRFGLTPRPDWPRLRPEPLPGETSASTRAIAEAMAAALERAKNEAVVVRSASQAVATLCHGSRAAAASLFIFSAMATFSLIAMRRSRTQSPLC